MTVHHGQVREQHPLQQGLRRIVYAITVANVQQCQRTASITTRIKTITVANVQQY